jgi:hypothetical protein
MLAQLTHPYVVGYVDSFFHQNYLCIVTEYCEGGDLYKRLKARRGGSLAAQRAAARRRLRRMPRLARAAARAARPAGACAAPSHHSAP